MRYAFCQLLTLIVMSAGVLLITESDVVAKDKHRGHGGGFSHFGISPYGLSYGYHGRGFSIHLGPSYGGYGYGFGGYPSYSPYYYSRPSYYYESPPRTYYRETVPDSGYVSSPTYTVRKANPTSIIATNEQAASYQVAAEQAFRERRYNDALRSVEHAILEDGTNGKLYLFQAQVLFAVGEYEAAAASIGQAMKFSEPSDWGYVIENYTKFYTGREYVEQMERLVEYSKQNPNDASAHFVRGYNYLFLGYEPAANKLLAKVLEIDANDDSARTLLALTNPEPLIPPPPAELPPADASQSSASIESVNR